MGVSGMPSRDGSAFEPIHLPDHVWRQYQDVLQHRDVGRPFRLAKRYAGPAGTGSRPPPAFRGAG